VPQILVNEVRMAGGVTLGVRIGGWLEYVLSLAAAGMVVAGLVARRRERRTGADRLDPPSPDQAAAPALAGRAPQ
jgi:hypothetical protein